MTLSAFIAVIFAVAFMTAAAYLAPTCKAGQSGMSYGGMLMEGCH